MCCEALAIQIEIIDRFYDEGQAACCSRPCLGGAVCFLEDIVDGSDENLQSAYRSTVTVPMLWTLRMPVAGAMEERLPSFVHLFDDWR